ncbi:hypothetical protein OP492_03650 [Pseudomonas mosselii]|uniref:hypothetical protein n=1 Tax=Pseudomonas mosselii TaxID=78327 RepID=UPI0021A58E82|nr:hypothetical protein [Pseudomonas mosselii]MEA3233749.1 hypothetical protein [Pseudomonas mosselii]UWS68996.1 hypothetical protein N0U38_09475 [Pseudomonas mosselii]
MSNSAPLATLLKNRGALLQILVATVFLAVGVNLLSSAIADSLSGKPALWGLATLLLLTCLIIVAKQTIPSRHVYRKMKGFLVIHSETKELIKVPRYHFSESLKSFFVALFAENTAPKRLWNSDPIENAFKDIHTNGGRIRETEAGKLIIEATEYYLLEQLSIHLTDYFGKSKLESKQLQKLSRENIPDIVFNNRFLDTFSRPMRERAAFTTESAVSLDSQAIMCSGPGGIRYSKFGLTLPLGANVQRLSPGSISIETPKLTLKIVINFKGFSANLPHHFSNLYLDGLSFFDNNPYEIELSTSVEFKHWSLLSRSGWEYHAWLDSFLTRLESNFVGEEFFKKINWETAATVARLVLQKLHSAESPSSESKPPSTQNINLE